MATTSFKRTHRMRATFAAVACTLSVSLISTTTPAIAQDNASVTDKLQHILGGNVSVATLASAIADAQEEISRLEDQLGQFRERANKSLVDLEDSRTLLDQARLGTVSAREELDDAQLEVQGAQEKLNEISRSAYRRANTSESITVAAGGDAREDMLARQTFLRLQGDKQQDTITQLERVRTQKSNQESLLRKSEQLATDRQQRAELAEKEARRALEDNESRIGSISSKRDELVSLEQEAQAVLDSTKGEEPPVDTGESTARPSKTAPTGGEAEEAPQVESLNEPPSVAKSASPSEPGVGSSSNASDAASAPISAGQSGTLVTDPQATSDEDAEQAPSEPSSVTVPSEEGAQEAFAQSSSNIDGEQVAQIAGLAVSAAAAVVAASQPSHSIESNPSGDASEDPGSLSDALLAGSSALYPMLGPSEETEQEEGSLLTGLSGILKALPTTKDVQEKASLKLGDASREAKIEAAIARAESQLGVQYAWGGGDANGPTMGIRDGGVADSYGDYNKIGFDCSGLVIYAFAGVGISLPHYTGYQYTHGTQISPQEMERGDLIFYGPSGNHHVAIYLGNGTMIEAPQSGQTVRVSPVRWSGMSQYAVRLI